MGLSLKSILPVAGAAAGFFLGGPAGSAAVNAALGSGIGTLLSGGDLNDAVKNAALAGAGAYGMQAAGIAGAGSAGVAEVAAGGIAPAAQTAGPQYTAVSGATGQALATETAKKGIMSGLPAKALTGALVASAFQEPEQPVMTEEQRQMMLTGERDPSYQGQNIVPTYDYRTNQVVYARDGGYIQGPGSGRSDSVRAGIFQNGQKVQEARLSDGEFVMTERAVRGAGNGDRAAGASRMYEMMRQYEGMA